MAKSKLTKDIIGKVRELTEAGQPECEIYSLVGVSAMTWSRWKRAGEEDYALQKDTDLRDFYAALQSGRSAFIRDNLSVIREASKRDWKAAAWLLERRVPEHFALKQEVQANVEGITIKNDLPKAEIPTAEGVRKDA